MTYKDLNVYKRAYQVAIQLHQFLDKKGEVFNTDEINQLKSLSRKALAGIAESFSQQSSKAKRFFNFKALDAIHSLMMDLDFLHDVGRLPDKAYRELYNEYEVAAKQLYKLNQSILEKAKAPSDATVPEKEPVKA